MIAARTSFSQPSLGKGVYYYLSKFPRLAQILVLVLVLVVDQDFPRFRRIPRWFSVFLG